MSSLEIFECTTTTSANLVSAASRLTHVSVGDFDVDMPLTGTSGVEDRDGGGGYLAVFTFDTVVTSGSASVVGGTGTAGAPSFNGNEMQVPLTGVTDAQIVTVRVSGVNGGGGSDDVDFGFLIGDVDANRTVDRPDRMMIRANANQPPNISNFRGDINLNGIINGRDGAIVTANQGNSIP